jgi:hypothetical protein
MTTNQKVAHCKLSMSRLTNERNNVSEACRRIMDHAKPHHEARTPCIVRCIARRSANAQDSSVRK